MQTLMLNVGRRDGVAVDDIVVAAYPSAPTADHPPRNQSAGAAPDEAPVQGGLVGYVYQVAGRTCHVLLLTDRQSGVGARIQPKRARTEGVCKGIGGEDCLLKYLPNDADVREGDTVVSSGQGKFPPGIVIGKVTSVQRNDYDSTLEARVRPYVDFERLEEVQVLLLYRSEGDAP
jgi:rod shape-determining protein MreC